MRAVVQRVSQAWVKVDGETVGSIGAGLLVLVGVSSADTKEQAAYLARKIAALRIFGDGKMDLNVAQIGGAVLAISQFTLYGDVKKGNRPSFDAAAGAVVAREIYEYFLDQVRQTGLPVETGIFQATMEVGLVNHGPVTILVDTDRNF
jgi:D-tyrosyl-tRNA(Tyr) deacylase